jgi:hypothetical protein
MNVDFSAVIKEQSQKSIWSLHNVIDCIPDDMWDEEYCCTPLWKHVCHTLHSLDRWYINPYVYTEPVFHSEGLNDLNIHSNGFLSRDKLKEYASQVEEKINRFLDTLTQEALSETPAQCPFTRFELISAQHRHLDMHIGMLMGFVIAKTGRWPKVLGLMDKITAREACEYD